MKQTKNEIVCSTASTQYWIWDIGAEPYSDKTWIPWKVENQTAGFMTEFDLGFKTSSSSDNDNDDDRSSFIFATVHGAGHEVPAYRPVEALALFTSFFSGEWDVDV